MNPTEEILSFIERWERAKAALLANKEHPDVDEYKHDLRMAEGMLMANLPTIKANLQSPQSLQTGDIAVITPAYVRRAMWGEHVRIESIEGDVAVCSIEGKEARFLIPLVMLRRASNEVTTSGVCDRCDGAGVIEGGPYYDPHALIACPDCDGTGNVKE